MTIRNASVETPKIDTAVEHAPSVRADPTDQGDRTMTPIPIRLQPSFDQTVHAEREDLIINGLSIFVVTPSINDARDVAPLVAERLHPTISTDGVLSVESAVGRHGEIGFEVVLKVGARS